MRIKLLQANHGDAIHIKIPKSYNNHYNIIIDGGPKSTYNFKNRRNRTEQGALKTLLKDIIGKNEVVDLLIITHIDDDHIGGILKWVESEYSTAHELIKSVWYNSSKLISDNEKLEYGECLIIG